MKPIVLALTAFSFLAAPAAMAQPVHHGKPQQTQIHKEQMRKHAPQRQAWKKGSRLPQSYRGHAVKNYSAYKLRQPPRGYHWVKVNNDYLLIGITSGIISAIVNGH